MKITLLSSGKTGQGWIREGVSAYLDRLKHYCSCSAVDLPAVKNAARMDAEQLRIAEGKAMLEHIAGADHLVLLDERGTEFSSKAFSEWMRKKQNAGIRHIIFATGGAFGFSQEIYDRSNEKISLSKMTLPHQLVRIFFAEQLYRAFTIQKGEKYHHD